MPRIKKKHPPEYRWSHPTEWLHDKIRDAQGAGDVADLASIARCLLDKVEGDDVQDVFQKEMEDDGYFAPIRSEN